MAKQASAKGRKIGRWSRKPTNSRYKSENRCDSNKQRRMDRADKDYLRNFAKRKAQAILNGEPDPVQCMRKDRYPGWTYRDGYGYVRV